jgi:anti-sigma factor RsiW
MNCHAWQEQIDVYLDGELAGPDLQAMEAHLSECAACAAEALGRMQLKQTTRMAGMPFVPSGELRGRVESILRPKQRRVFSWGYPALAACLAAALLVAMALWAWRGRAAGGENVAEMVDLHVAAMGSPNPVDVASTDRHTVKPWFQGKVPFTFNVPELAGTEYSLLGGKVVYIHENAAAQLIFTLRKHEISAFIAKDGRDGAGTVSDASRNGFSVESWNLGGLHYVLVGDAGARDVRALGDLLRAAARD